MRLALIISLLVSVTANGATWFARPGVYTTLDGNHKPIPTASVYGTQDGTSYANAWNGTTSIVFGGAGVNPGDTLYLCGLHIYSYLTFSSDFFVQALVTNTVSGYTIRMDWPTDPGTVFGGTLNYHDPATAWLGPDANGVYHQSIQNLHQQTFEIHGTTITHMNAKTNVTWTDGPGEFYLSGTNYVKMMDGSKPLTNNILSYQFGYAIDLGKQSNIVFQSCNFISDQPIQWGGIRMTKPSYSGPASNHITWTNCTVFDSGTLWIYPDEDNWTFVNCELGRMNSGVYSIIDGQNRGPNQLTVQGCYIHDTDTAEFQDIDGHAVGIQGGNYHMVISNRTERTGSAIVLWTGSAAMSNATISGNFVKDMHIRDDNSGGGDGISISGDNTLAVVGLRTGISVNDNIVQNAGLTSTNAFAGRGITIVNKDATDVLNNTIVSAYIGLRIEPTGAAIKGRFYNNIISSPTTSYLTVNGSSYSGFELDNNLFYPAANTNSGFTFSPAHSAGDFNVFLNPLLDSSYHLSSLSPAIHAGASVGLLKDASGRLFDNPPSIGAYEYLAPRNLYFTAGHYP